MTTKTLLAVLGLTSLTIAVIRPVATAADEGASATRVGNADLHVSRIMIETTGRKFCLWTTAKEITMKLGDAKAQVQSPLCGEFTAKKITVEIGKQTLVVEDGAMLVNGNKVDDQGGINFIISEDGVRPGEFSQYK